MRMLTTKITRTTTTTTTTTVLTVGDLTFGECRPDVSPKCIVRCRDNDIDLSYRRVEPRRAATPLAGSKINETLSLVAMVAEVDRERGIKREREREGGREEGREGKIASRTAKGVSIALSSARWTRRETTRRAVFYSSLPEEAPIYSGKTPSV